MANRIPKNDDLQKNLAKTQENMLKHKNTISHPKLHFGI